VSESTPEDRAEQAAVVGAQEDAPVGTLPLEVDPADAAEQAAVVEHDEEEHR